MLQNHSQAWPEGSPHHSWLRTNARFAGHRAGEYVTVRVRIGDQLHERSYSISSAPPQRRSDLDHGQANLLTDVARDAWAGAILYCGHVGTREFPPDSQHWGRALKDVLRELRRVSVRDAPLAC